MNKLSWVVGVVALGSVTAMGVPAIDGQLGGGEWGSAAVYQIGTGLNPTPVSGSVYLYADQNYLYAALDVTAYTTTTSHHGDNLGIGVRDAFGNGVDFALSDYAGYDYSYGGTYQYVTAGSIDGYTATRWAINDANQSSLPTDLQASTSWASGHRITELAIPLLALGGLTVGQTLYICGDVDFAGMMHWYPADVAQNHWELNSRAVITVNAGSGGGDGGVPVPDGGATSALFGIAMAGLAGVRRLMSK